MRTLDNGDMIINYPDAVVLSGDLNRLKITKSTTATHVEIKFTIDGYEYKENLYFYTNDITFSMADILKLIFTRDYSDLFTTTEIQFDFTVTLYNNTTVVSTEILTIYRIVLGKRRVFDEYGNILNISQVDYDPTIDINYFGYYFPYSSDVYYILNDSSTGSIDTYSGTVLINLTTISDIQRLYYKVSNYMWNPSFLYFNGNNFWSSASHPACDTTFGVKGDNKLRFNMSDVSCGTSLTIEYSGGTFVAGNTYTCKIVVDEVVNPTASTQYIQFDLGGNLSSQFSGTGLFTEDIVCGSTGVLKLKGYFNPTGAGTHKFSAILIQVYDDTEIDLPTLNNDCVENGEKIAIRFLNRFGQWRFYYVIKKIDSINAGNGITLGFIDDNLTELSNLNYEQKKGYSNTINVFRNSLTKELLKDFTDIIYSDHVHLYDNVNLKWIPVKIGTNSFNTVERENLFDISLNIILQATNE